jgi:hypothetical protein
MTTRRVVTRIISTLCVSAAACDTPTAPDPLLWQADLVAESVADEMQGSVAMVAGTNTSIGIGIFNGPAENTLRWVVRSGRCATTGTPVAPASTFPNMTVSAEGEAGAETTLRRRLDGNAEYAAEVFFVTDATPIRAACADLERVE